MILRAAVLGCVFTLSACGSKTQRADNYMFIVDASSKASLSYSEWIELPSGTKLNTAALYYLQNVADETGKKSLLKGDMTELYDIANQMVTCASGPAASNVEKQYAYSANSLSYCAKTLNF